MNTKLILRKDVENLGSRGEVVSVKPGHARNFLLPQGLAYPASDANLRRVAREHKRMELRDLGERKAAEELAQRLAQVQLTVVKKVAEDQNLYGSVTVTDIVEGLAAQGITIDRSQVLLEEPIKKLGLFDVELGLHSQVKAAIKLWVVKEDDASA